MDHNQEREKDDHWKVCQHNIVNFLINVCHLPFTAEEINHGVVLGVRKPVVVDIYISSHRANRGERV